ncbi:MAG: C45 family autoproteolytic acyltransferase/hydrolase [Planctomycetota bacterium]|jgi:hypothetical protein
MIRRSANNAEVRLRLLTLLLILCAAPGCALVYRHQIKAAMRTPAAHGRARLEIYEGVPVVHLYGSAEEMAAQYGALLKPALQALAKYGDSLLPAPTKKRLIEYARGQEPLLPEDIRRQLQALADASGVPYDDIVALNVVPRIRCTTLAVWGPATADGALIMGRNADYFGMGLADRGSLIVVCHSSEEKPVVLVSFLGMLGGFAGINSDGVAFGNMLVFNATGPRCQDGGLPVQLAMRLAAEKADDAQSMARELGNMKHVIPMNVMVADLRRAMLLELGLSDTVIRHGKNGVLAASNDFLEHPLRAGGVYCRRYNALVSAAAKHGGGMGVEEVKKALHAARIATMNIQAVIFEPAAMRMHVSINRCPASAGPYTQFDLRQLLED